MIKINTIWIDNYQTTMPVGRPLPRVGDLTTDTAFELRKVRSVDLAKNPLDGYDIKIVTSPVDKREAAELLERKA